MCNEIITQNEKDYLLTNMEELLEEYDYSYSRSVLKSIIDEWANQKKGLIKAFKNHPNYVEGKFMIALQSEFERIFNDKAIRTFSNYIDVVASSMYDNVPDDIKKKTVEDHCLYLPNKLYQFLVDALHSHITGKTISADTAELLEEIIPQIHPHVGEKSSRVINRICTYLGYHKHPEYNREFAKFADALSPTIIKRKTILSLHPLDYLTMSFGNSWASCHTIDKHNKRGMPDNYSGCYSSGTMSYMLDTTSMVLYTVSDHYAGNEYWQEAKINRQIFCFGEDKLLQSRLYPKDNDSAREEYSAYRNIVQGIMAKILNVPNLWTLARGVDTICNRTVTHGTHYTDYLSYDNCTLSTLKDSPNENPIHIGALPICIECGVRHNESESINHCNTNTLVCEHCGCVLSEDDAYYINGLPYCGDCVYYCEDCGSYHFENDVQYVESVGNYVCYDCLRDYYSWCEDCGEYYPSNEMVYVRGIDEWVCKSCLEESYMKCSECNEYYSKDYINVVGGAYYCADCFEDIDEEDEE